jgi:chromosome partitioning protein
MREGLAQRIKKMLSPEDNLPFGGRQAKVIAVSAQKGGVGKTTTTVNLGACLAQFHEQRVLIIDMDPQGHISISLGRQFADNGNGLGEVLTARNGFLMNTIVHTDLKNLDITLSDRSLLETEAELAGKIGREFMLRRALTRARTYYDFILIDCPPNLGNLTVNAYLAADYLIVPCELSALALEGMEGLLDAVETVHSRLNHPLRILGILVTRVDRRNLVMNQTIQERLKEAFADQLFQTQITINTDLNKAQLAGMPIFQYDGSASGARDYRAFTDELLARLQPETFSGLF